MPRTRLRHRPAPHLQRGQAVLFIVLLLGVAIAVFAYGAARSVSLVQDQDLRTEQALMQARDALIGRAVSNANRPGSLPCPDFDDGTLNPINVANDGVADVMVGNACPSYIGRLPWKTLGLPQLRDAGGELLWYALSPRFRDNAAAGLLDNDTKGTITVYVESTATTLTTEAVAVIFAPSLPLANQNRSATTTALCPTTGTTIARNLCAANYLEATGGVNNASATGPYVSAQRTTGFNDRVLVLTTTELMPPVERRAAREMLALLQAYRAASPCACYPWASDDFDDDSVTGKRRGGVPIEDALPHTWASLGITVPAWMIGSNEWGKRFYYAVAPSQTATPTPGMLTVDGTGKLVVLISTAPAGASRPSTNLADYVHDLENRNNDDVFVTPSSTAYARNRIYTVP